MNRLAFVLPVSEFPRHRELFSHPEVSMNTFTKTTPPLKHTIHLVQCPHCHAPEHHYCRDHDGSPLIRQAHEARALHRIQARARKTH